MKKYFSKGLAVVAGMFGVAVTATSSLAALAVDQQAVVDAIDLQITDLTTWAWTAILAVLGFTIAAKLLKRFARSATS